jgi:DNA-binding MarR family transcriptional regulator
MPNKTEPTEENPIIKEMLRLYKYAVLIMKGFRLPVNNPVQIEEDFEGRTTEILFLLGQRPLRMSLIADIFSIHPSTATLLVDKWVNKGYVKRRGSDFDRRVVILELDEAGKELYKEIYKRMHDTLVFFASTLTPEEQEQFFLLFKKMIDHHLIDRMIPPDGFKVEGDYVQITLTDLKTFGIPDVPINFIEMLTVAVDGVIWLDQDNLDRLDSFKMVWKDKVLPLHDMGKFSREILSGGDRIVLLAPNISKAKSGEEHTIEISISDLRKIKIKRIFQ